MEAQLEKLISVVSTLIALQLVTLTTDVGVTWYSHKQLKDDFSTTVATTGRQPDVPERLENWRGIVREYNSAQGREDAAVVVVEYSDFQCPFCKKYSDETRRQIVAKYGDNLRMVFKHFPLQQLHPQAMTAAIAANARGERVSSGRFTSGSLPSPTRSMSRRSLALGNPSDSPQATPNASSTRRQEQRLNRISKMGRTSVCKGRPRSSLMVISWSAGTRIGLYVNL